MQIVTVVIVFSTGTQFKKEIWNNKLLLVYLVITVLFGYYLILVPNVNSFFQLLPMNDQNFRFILIIITICNFFLAMYTEKELMPIFKKWWDGKWNPSKEKSDKAAESDSRTNQKEQLVSNRN